MYFFSGNRNLYVVEAEGTAVAPPALTVTTASAAATTTGSHDDDDDDAGGAMVGVGKTLASKLAGMTGVESLP
jgi:hypothetical protein